MPLFAAVLFAQTDWIQILVQLGALGLLAYIIIVSFPAYRKEEREGRKETIDALQKGFEARTKEVVRSNDRGNAATSDLLEKVVEKLDQIKRGQEEAARKLDGVVMARGKNVIVRTSDDPHASGLRAANQSDDQAGDPSGRR